MSKGADKRIYRLAETELDPFSGRVKRSGGEIYLRPKTLQVLLYLIEQRPRLISKEELLEQIWQGAAVTDDALVQSIVEIRKALGENSQQPRFIKTFPKAGYRFIGEVEAHNDTLSVEQVTSVEIEYEEEWENERAEESAHTFSGPTQIVRASDRPITTPLRSRVSPKLLAAFVLILALPFGTYLYRRGSTVPPLIELTLPRVPGKHPVAVMYFENRTGDRELDWMREGLADMLIANLSRFQRLTLLSRQQLAALLNRTGHQNAEPIGLEEALEIARRAQADMMILGGFARIGEKVRIDVILHDAHTGQLQAAESLIADTPAQILTQIDLLSLKLATHLNATLVESDAQRGLAAVMTNNLDAYRYYSLALEQAQMFQFHESISLFEKAIALDPQFALAHARIGYVYAVRMGEGEKAMPHLEKALALSDRLSEKDRLFITAWEATATHDSGRAIEIYKDLLARYPMETEAYQRLGWVLQTQNRNEEALQVIQRGLLADPDWKDLHNVLGTVSMRLGRNEEARGAFQRYIQLAPNDPNAWDSLGLLEQWVGQYAEAEAAYQHALALNPESGVAIIHLGHLRFQQGRYRAAIEQYRRFIQIARDDGGRARGFDCLGWLYLRQGDLARASAAIKQELKYNPASVWNSLPLAFERRDPAAIAKLSEAAFAPATFALYKERGMLRLWEYQRGFVALRLGHAQEALQHFRAALQHRALEWNVDSFEGCLADAYLSLGQMDEAIAEYERILRINPNYPLAQFRLAKAYQGKGDQQRALSAYRNFLQIWKDADADIPEVQEAKALLAATP
ncbi:MAG: tetratricopeptide repeat protein [Acidobacteria bacterium]|nr:tetratricopeptide repeat protein [Acidobacteriota bacterium]